MTMREFLMETHPGYYYSKAGKALVADLEAEWVSRHRSHRPYSPPRHAGWRMSFWHRRLLFQVGTTKPKFRRVFWIWGDSLVGKGHLTRFLADRESYNTQVFESTRLVWRGFLDCSTQTCVEKVAMLYKSAKLPGICLFDVPREQELPPSMLLEYLSNAGQPLTGGRYEGTHDVKANAHVVVFANKAPPASIDHREVWLLHVTAPDAQPQWQFPFRRPDDQDAAAAAALRSAAVPLPEDQAAVAAAAMPAPLGCVAM